VNRIVSSCVPDYSTGVREMLGKLLLLAAVLLMPFGMAPAAASASPQAMASMPMGHCPDQDSSHSPKAGIADCTMACAGALPAVAATREEPLLAPAEPVLATASQALNSLHPETATPPPKRS
jgi:hypothetical protein